MPGFDQTQADLIAKTIVQGTTNAFANIAAQLQAQQAVLAETTRRFFKPPALFKVIWGGTKVPNYAIAGSDKASVAYINAGASTVAVYNIEDADSVEISAYFSNNEVGVMALFYSLSVNGDGTPIPVDQFAQIPSTSAIDDGAVTTEPNYIWNAHVKVPCSGYKYLHLFGFVAASVAYADWVSEFLADPAPAEYNQTISLFK